MFYLTILVTASSDMNSTLPQRLTKRLLQNILDMARVLQPSEPQTSCANLVDVEQNLLHG